MDSTRPLASMLDYAASDREGILRAATDLNGDPAVALLWYHCDQIVIFDGKTAEQLVNEGRGDDLLRYLRSLEAGFAG
jgi:hypothetical protein